MLLFRSEETVRAWCEARGLPMRPRISLAALWHLAVTWYSNRLTVDSRRPAASEMAGIFAEAGLTGAFWDPRSDAWGPKA
jgi:hypothetical protein